MKKISEHLGQIIAALAAVALLIGCVSMIGLGPITGFFGNIVEKESNVAQNMMDKIEAAQAVDPNAVPADCGHDDGAVSGDGAH